MGAGCYYTTTGESQVQAYWYGFDYSDEAQDDSSLAYDEQKGAFDQVHQALRKLPKYAAEHSRFDFWQDRVNYGEWYTIDLRSTYNADGVIIDMGYQGEEYQRNPLAEANFDKTYQYIVRTINKHLPLRVATSGYTARTVNIGEL